MRTPAGVALSFFLSVFVFSEPGGVVQGRRLTGHIENGGGWITFKSETYALSPGTCKHWEFQSLTKNIVRVMYSPMEFPEGCSPEKNLRLIPKIYSTDECLDGGDCRGSSTKLHDGNSLCKNFEELSPINFTSNVETEAEKSFILTSEPMCTGEKRSLFAIKSTCQENVEVHITVEAKIVLESSGHCGALEHEGGNETEILIAVGLLAALTAGICLCLIHLRIRNKKKERINLVAQMHTYGSAATVPAEAPRDRLTRITPMPNIPE